MQNLSSLAQEKEDNRLGNLTIKRYLSIIKEVPLEMNDTTKVEDRRVK